MQRLIAVAFAGVTRGLDPIDTRERFLALARQAAIPMMTVYGDQTSP